MASRRNGRALAVAIGPIRCAIYTRKSTDEGLDQNFNTLDAQRDAAESYIESQRQEAWSVISERYDDGGYSGGNLGRPALKRLLADIEAGSIDAVVVYKYDRLSRSMLDFLQMLDFFERHHVSFVSVSQRFDTSTPIGRMTLQILMSFGEFERQIIAERTRDKICAARRRGKWTGGVPPLGYDVAPEGGALVVNKPEAEQVRAIFKLYTEVGSLMKTVEELNRRGWRRKSWTTKTGKILQGGEWQKRTLRQLLIDPRYIGQQVLGDEVFDGEHEGIVPTRLFDEVERQLRASRANGGAGTRNRHGALLRGLVRCASCKVPMIHSVTRSRGKSYRYYRCGSSIRRGAASCPTGSVPATKIEQFVVDQIRRIGLNPELQRETFEQAVAQAKAHLRGLKAEDRRLKRDLTAAGKRIESLVDALAETTGPSRLSVQAALENAQEHGNQLEKRQAEVRQETADLQAQTIDQPEVARALEAFDPLWEVLLTPEKERVLKLLIERVTYDGATEDLAVHWRLPGFAELADEIGAVAP